MLITGGAGYIGSHLVLAAIQEGHKVTVLDNLSTGLKKNVDYRAEFIQGSTNSESDLSCVFENNSYDGVIHLAASKAAGESMANPSKYLDNNIIGSLNLIKYCVKYKVKLFVFSSSAAVYGSPKYNPIDEKHPLNPGNYYGYTKIIIEENLRWFSKLAGIRYAALRYFNAAGYDIQKRIQNVEVDSSNLIPKIMETAIGLRPTFNIYGNNYDTHDGTGVRDYIHVNDLVKAHLTAIKYLNKYKKNLTINLGAGHGYSVLDVKNKIEEVSNKKIKFNFKQRRDGDPDIIIAKASLANQLLNWEAQYSDLDTIISTAWDIYKLQSISSISNKDLYIK